MPLSRPFAVRSLQWLTRSLRPWLMLACALAVLGAWVGHRWTERTGLAQLLGVSSERLELYAGMLESEIARYAQLPRLVAIDAEATAVLASPDDPALREQADRRLARVAARSGVRALWVVDPEGRRLATSDAPSSADARRPTIPPARLRAEFALGVPGFFAADPGGVGTDYYVIHAVPRPEQPRGWIVARVNLAPLEATWVDLGARTQSERVLVTDNRRLVLLSSVPAWKASVLDPQQPDQLMQATAVSADEPAPGAAPAPPPARLLLRTTQTLTAGARLAEVIGPGRTPSSRTTGISLAQDNIIPSLGVDILALSDTAEVRRMARWSGFGGAATGAFIGLLGFYLRHRARSMRQMATARDHLRQAHDELERQVQDRTRELQDANLELQRQIAERLKIQDELIQAGKLAALGQMSAEISHEINQPLTALGALSSNTRQLLALGRHDAVTRNLESISGLLERMARMARQLKSFARQGPAELRPLRVIEALDNVRVLLEHRLRVEMVNLRVDVAPALRVLCDGGRLEQVLLNLMGNALDAIVAAVPPGGRREIRVAAQVLAGRCELRVSDTGGGIPQAQLDRFFEPFFTTKPPGQGLGLGLVISQNIVREYGGSLRAARDADGLVFTFDLPIPQEA